jgi:hypothetical protein
MLGGKLLIQVYCLMLVYELLPVVCYQHHQLLKDTFEKTCLKWNDKELKHKIRFCAAFIGSLNPDIQTSVENNVFYF